MTASNMTIQKFSTGSDSTSSSGWPSPTPSCTGSDLSHLISPRLQEMHRRLSKEFTPGIVGRCLIYSSLEQRTGVTSSSSSVTENVNELEMRYRIAINSQLQMLSKQLFASRPHLPLSEDMHRGFQQLIFSVYRFPGLYTELPDGNREKTRVENLLDFLKELNASPLEDREVAHLLRRGLAQYTPTVTNDAIQQGAKLIKLQHLAKSSMRKQTLEKDQEYSLGLYRGMKDMTLISNSKGEVIGKLKTFIPEAEFPNNFRCEALGYAYDQLAGIGMTCATKTAWITLEDEIRQIAHFFKTHREDEARLRFSELPDAIRACIDLGKSAKISARAIELYLKSDDFKSYKDNNELARKEQMGTLQVWAKGATAVKTLLTDSPGTGLMLRNIPVAVAHTHALLAWIKGAKDCHIANTLITPGAPTLLDCDDEHLLTLNNIGKKPAIDNFRLWQFGLPQSGIPFSRAELFLLATSYISQKLQEWNQSQRSVVYNEGKFQRRPAPWISAEASDAQQLRMQEVERRAKDALLYGPPFSPQDLYHEMVEGSSLAVRAKQNGVPGVLAYDTPLDPWWDSRFFESTFIQNMHELYPSYEVL
ncbi:MAG: hypothetical protein V4492_06625 [Chlamydiota bacterium]